MPTLVSVLLLSACNDTGKQDDKAATSRPAATIVKTLPRLNDPATIVAEDRMGPITLADIDNFIVGLTPNKRWQHGTEPGQWYRGIIERIALDRLLLDEAELIAADQEPAFLARQHEILRNIYSNQYLASSQTAALQPSEDELMGFYQDHSERYHFPEQRRVQHIFKSIDANVDGSTTRKELEVLRSRVIDGENFTLLAEKYSDSETRHHEGALGLLGRGHFSEDFDRVVFSLELNTPSQVVATDDGFHLFFVSQIL
ncbi:MAG: peptidylprolyl isomerase, partial [Methyloprofundus sp.]|nr:peptidylprolyl isomerase [Methyloprofundus sp.]